MFKTGIRNIYRDFCRYVIPNSNAMKCKCFVDRFVSANCSMKRLALSGKVIVKLIILIKLKELKEVRVKQRTKP